MATAQPARPDARPIPDSSPQIAASDAQVLAAFLLRAARRGNALTVLRHITRAMLPAAIGSALGVLAYRFYLLSPPQGVPAAALPPILLAGSALAGAVLGWRRRVGPSEAARDADKKWKLHDLLASGWAFAQPAKSRSAHAVSTPFVPPLVGVAAAKARGLSIKELYPLRVERSAQVLAVSLGALLGASLMSDNPYFLDEEQRKVNATLKRAGQKMQRAAQAARQDKKLSQDARAQIAARRMEALAQRMQGGRMTRKQALLSLDQLKRDMARAGKPNPSSPSPSQMQKLRDALAGGSYQTDEARKMQSELKQKRDDQAAKNLDELARKLEENKFGSQQERDKAANDMEQAARALRRSGKSNEDAAKQLEEAAKSLRQNQSPGQQQNGPQQNGQQNGQQGQSGTGPGSDQLRKMAQDLRSSQGGDSTRDMMERIEEAERSAGGGDSNGQGGAGQGQSGQGQEGAQEGKDGKGQGQNGKGRGNGRGAGAGAGGGDGRQVASPGRDLRASNPTRGEGGGAGLGPRSNIKGGQGAGGGISKQRIGQSNDSRKWADVWSDRLPQARQQTDRIKGQMGQNGESERLQTRGEAKGGAARTPYYDVYESYKRDAEDAIARENVPPAYRDSVKQYFDRMKP